MSTVLYPGSFDPIHLGHLDIIEQSAELFGDVVVAVMHNEEKPAGVFSVDDRVRLIEETAADIGLGGKVRVVTHSGLAVDAARLAGVDFIVKGLRNAGDFEIEQQMALTNHSVSGVRTVYLPCRMDRGFISSRFVREIARYGGAVQHLVPRPVAVALTTTVPACGQSEHDMRDDDQTYYDDYDDIDEEDYSEAPPVGYVGDAETLLRRSIDIIATAPTMPLSSSPRIDRDEIIELLEEALQRLPDELRQARWMLKERQEFVAKTRREAEEILEAARVRAERMVQRTEVVRAAEQRARQVMEGAETDARRLRHETEDFLDQRLGSFEILLDKLQKTVNAGRQRLSIGALPPNTGEHDVEDPTKGFFDQDG